MTSHGPQRSRSIRVAQGHTANQGSVGQAIHPRESSPSPALRERTRPSAAVPPVSQMYASQALAQQIPPQASPTGSSNSRPSPPTNNLLPRHLPTPPQASTSPNEVGVNPSLSQILPNHASHGVHYSRAQIALLTRYQNSDHDYHITPELLDAIERADEQAQTQNGSPAFANYPRNDSATPPDLGQDRIRVAERTSPSLDPRRRDALPARESPTVRQPHSPSSFAQTQASLSERLTSSSSARSSPLDGGSSGETYTAYMARDSPPVQTRRRPVTVANVNEPRGQYSLTNQSPPLQSRPTAARSLPVQEEDDPRVGKDDPYSGVEQLAIPSHHNSSPIPSSDALPEGTKQHFEKTQSVLAHQEHYSDESDGDGAKTPRSPSVGLPDKHVHIAALSARIPARISGRTGPMEQLGLRGIEETIQQSSSNITQPSHNSYRGGQHPIQRKLSVDPNHQYQQAQYYADESSPYSGLYHAGGQFHPDEYYAYADPSQYYYPEAHYAERPRPDAPIPPTPHSQTTAPSPASFSPMYQRNGRNYVAPSPIPLAGSPYPAPFEHVRRNVNASRNAHPQVYDPRDPNFDLNLVREQIAGQWQKFAQNTHMATMSDSTFSPSATPFQGNFAPWAHLHARRTLGRALDLRSMQSSPALERIERHERPPSAVFRSKKKQHASKLSTEVEVKSTPPRVQSTQPRDTSPEPSTSGEETAGEDRHTSNTPNGNGWVHDDGDNEWVDEDEETDEDDLLELEYHPSYVKNVSKRRRRWENGWERLLEAFETLDRQTDATMVLMAAPSHSTKLHTVRSRCIRRQTGQPNAPDMTPLKVAFKRIATHRRKTRSYPQTSLAEKIRESSVTPGESSDGSEMGLRRAYETAVNSLGAFERIFEEREARWAEEMRRIGEDRERMDLLLRQILGANRSLSDVTTPEAPLL